MVVMPTGEAHQKRTSMRGAILATIGAVSITIAVFIESGLGRFTSRAVVIA